MSAWLPCDFYRARKIDNPCVKLRGPKTEARRSLSKRLSTTRDAVISGEDALLLQYAYSGLGYLSDFFKKLSAAYRETISDSPFRYAILALASYKLEDSSKVVFRRKGHISQAHRGLIRKIDTPSMISFSDVLASFILWSIDPELYRIHF